MRKIARSLHGGSILNIGSPGQIPVNTSLPTLQGIGQVGKSLNWSDGGWDNLPTSFTYQLNRNGNPIAGATTEPYTQTANDFGQQLTISVTATNVYGSPIATSIVPAFGIYVATLSGLTDTLLLSDDTHEINHAHVDNTGRYIAFVKYYPTAGSPNPPSIEGGDYRNTEILILEVATGIVTVLVPHNPAFINANPVWWPDSSKIIYITDQNTGNGQASIGQFVFSPAL